MIYQSPRVWYGFSIDALGSILKEIMVLSGYLVSGVWQDNNGNLTHLHVHRVSANDTFEIGAKKTKSEVISLIESGYVFTTIIWSYPRWDLGAKVEVVSSVYGKYLRTNRDKTAKDNLDNLINMKAFDI